MNDLLDLITEAETAKDMSDQEVEQVVEKMVLRFDSKQFQGRMLNDMQSRFEAGRARALASLKK